MTIHTQRTLNFDLPLNVEAAHVAQQTSEPPPASLPKQTPPLLRPDRQLTYDGICHDEWPDAKSLHDRYTITVDRTRYDIDGPPHRFIIRRYDSVEVFLEPNRSEVGQVTEINHNNQEVRVRFRDGTEGDWFSKELIYPAIKPQPEQANNSAQPPSQIFADANHTQKADQTERVCEPTASSLPPFTFDDFKSFHREFLEGQISFALYHEQFKRLLSNQDSVKSELISRFKARELATIATRMGSFDARRSTKEQNAASIVSTMLSCFVLDGTVSYRPLSGETYAEAVQEKVLAVTEEDYAREFEKRRNAAKGHEKALKNPETLLEFHTFLRAKDEDALTDEQLALYDSLSADMSRKLLSEAAPTTVTKFQSEELHAIEFQMKKGFHEKRQCPLWIVQLSTRVEREAFHELNRKAKMLDGWFSSFKKSDSGFQFLEKDHAERFCALLSGDADRSDVLELRKERKELTAAERLHQLAIDLNARAEETLDRSSESLQNTARRAEIQAGVRGQAYADRAMSRTLHSIAEALSRGEAKYLDGIRHKTHVETLEVVLKIAKWARIRAIKRTDCESTYGHDRRLDDMDEEPIGSSVIRFAEYPYPSIFKRHLDDLVNEARHQKGVKQVAAKMAKRLAREKEEYVTFKTEHDVEALEDFLSRAQSSGLDVERVASSLEKYKRLVRANLTDIHELRAALREYFCHRAEARGDSAIQIAERELIGKNLPGFFPTPQPVIERMLELADVKAYHKVLEPSCGKGDILVALQERNPGIELHAMEKNRALADVLSAKGFQVEFGDFLEHESTYDRILQNPPFEGGADIVHIKHAYTLLTDGGKLVSVISEGPFFRSDKQSAAFREWLEEVEGESEKLPEDAFQGRTAFRETGVHTRLVTIEKGEL